jgi:hypothetical protein
MEVHKLVVLSTSHITPHEAGVMEFSPQEFPFVYACFEEGFFVSCVTARGEYAAGHGPYAEGSYPALKALREWAYDNDFMYVMLDRDGDTVEELTVYDW